MTSAPLLTRAYDAPSHPRHSARHQLAVALRLASSGLRALARRIAPAPRQAGATAGLPCVEFHAEAGAPEGALYVDGVLIGHLPGVMRL
jgi:hypothetical protein